jgi:hypothetical protein
MPRSISRESRRRLHRGGAGRGCRFFLAALALLAPWSMAGEIDRLIAVVNGSIITSSDLELSRNLNVLLSVGKVDPHSSKEEEVQRLIDLEILRQELGNFPAIQIDPKEIEAEMANLRTIYAEIGGMPVLLRRLGLQESELREYLSLQVSVMKFVQFRFEPFITISEEAVRAYYEKELVPELHKRPAATIPPVEDVRVEIEKLLRQKEVDTSLEKWLVDVRKVSRIEIVSDFEQKIGGGPR